MTTAPTTAAATEAARPVSAEPSDRRRHFEEHGWVLLPGVLDQTQVERYRDCIERAAEGPYAALRTKHVRCDHLILRDPAFIEFITIAEILQTYSDIAGCAAVLKNSWSLVNSPWPDRHDPEAVARFQARPSERGWHRGSQPKWATYADEDHPGMHHFPYLNFFAYLTDVGPGTGITPVMDGSHKVSGDYEAVRERCEPLELTASAGDVLVFTESLMHAGTTILTESTRHAMAYTFVPSFYANSQDREVPRWFYDQIGNEDLRGVLGEWRGISSPHGRGLMEPYVYDFTTRIDPGITKG